MLQMINKTNLNEFTDCQNQILDYFDELWEGLKDYEPEQLTIFSFDKDQKRKSYMDHMLLYFVYSLVSNITKYQILSEEQQSALFDDSFDKYTDTSKLAELVGILSTVYMYHFLSASLKGSLDENGNFISEAIRDNYNDCIFDGFQQMFQKFLAQRLGLKTENYKDFKNLFLDGYTVWTIAET
jgi:hypothetical protein